LEPEVKNIFCTPKEIFLVDRKALKIGGFRRPGVRPNPVFPSEAHYGKRSNDPESAHRVAEQ
jgi:hypothetical protein